MPPRIQILSLAQLADFQAQRLTYICSRCRYSTAASATIATTTSTPAPSDAHIQGVASMSRHSTIQPASHRDPRYRKSQLLRSYVSLLQSTPLIILFQHNNLKAMEWASIRRELAIALQKIDNQLQAQGADAATQISDSIKLQIVQTNMLDPALRITEYYKPRVLSSEHSKAATLTPTTLEHEKLDPSLTHALSESAYLSAKAHRGVHPLSPLLTGPLALLNFPSVSPLHIKAALSVLSPQTPAFPAPTRRANPSYHEPAVQDGLKKLMLLGARIDGQLFDTEGVRWIGGIEGGIDGLRAQLVAMLQGFGGGLAQTLESASRSLWFALEGRRRMLDEGDDKSKEEDTKS